jgi:hypothetical protein
MVAFLRSDQCMPTFLVVLLPQALLLVSTPPLEPVACLVR